MSRILVAVLRALAVTTTAITVVAPNLATAQSTEQPIAPEYHIYAGNTHAHTRYTWSHGEQWAKNPCRGVPIYLPDPKDPAVHSWSAEGNQPPSGKCPSMIIIGSSQYPGPYNVLKPDWQKFQGPPSEHFKRAKDNGYDFYVVTDHSQDAAFQPVSPTNPAWVETEREADAATTPQFIAIRGYEHSENNGPNGVGHLNVFNSATYLNALDPGIDLPTFYKWLKTAKPNGDGPVVVSFNHPGPDQYNDWAYRDPQITDIITTLEVINSNVHIHEEGFINALDKGWKVSPVSGNDNHGLTGIAGDTSRTFVLATSRTKAAILDAMKHRRTYASMDRDIQCRYSVNGALMGSTLKRPNTFKFDIQITDPDTNEPKDKITKIQIVKDHGEVVQTYAPDTPSYSVNWTPTITDSTSKYFYIRVWNAGGGDAPSADPSKPMTWLAPVWTGR